MTPTAVLPEMAAGAAPAMRRAVDLPEGGSAGADAVTWMLRQSKVILDFASGCRDALQALLEQRGMDPRPLKVASDAMAECLDIFLGSADRLREAVRRRSTPENQAAQAAELDRQVAQAQDARRSFGEWLKVLNRPLPPIDLKKLEEDLRADVEAGRMIRLEKFEDLFPNHPGEN